MADQTGPTHIGELVPDPKNARKHNPRNVGMIETALRDVGAARSVVIDENGVVLAGNATIEAAAAAGIVRVVTVDTDGETIVAVRRTGLTEEQKTRLALFDNRAAELASWDVDQLQDLWSAGDVAVDDLFYQHEVEKLLAEHARGDAPFTPYLEPNTTAAAVTANDVAGESERMGNKYQEHAKYYPVVCPECAHQFYLDGRIGGDDPAS